MEADVCFLRFSKEPVSMHRFEKGWRRTSMNRDEDLRRDDQVFVDLPCVRLNSMERSEASKYDCVTHQVKAPVQNTDQNFHGATAHRQDVLDQK